MAHTDHVGDTVPTPEELEKLKADIASVRERVGRFGIMLPSEERGSFLKPRIGAAEMMTLVARLAQEKGVNIAGMPLGAMESDLQVGDAARSLEEGLADCLQLAADTRLCAYSEAWQAFLGYYAVLSSMASRDAALASRLRPVVEFMSKGARSKVAKSA